MFYTPTAIRVLGLTTHPQSGETQTTLPKADLIASADSKLDVQVERPARDVGLHHPEWWEYHNYGRR